MKREDIEKSVQKCYSTWGTTYYDDYYGEKAAYPPVHREIVKNLLKKHHVKSLLDAGCGPASFLREVFDTDMNLYGFDLTKEMVQEAQRLFSEQDISPKNIWEGSVLDSSAFQIPGKSTSPDAVICLGVLPHIPKEQDKTVYKNLYDSVKKGGLAIIEARNQFFGLFTMNRYSYDFIQDELIQLSTLEKKSSAPQDALKNAKIEMKKHFRMDLPPIRKGKVDEPGYDEVLSRTHNPLEAKQQFEEVGFKDVKVLFYHYHCLPPMFSSAMPEFFKNQSIAMENPEDWRGYFMASAFLLAGTKK